MADGVGLSVGATNLAAVVVGRTAVTRSPVLTLYPHRPPEVGVPSENPNLTERGLIITDFVDRVGDPVAIVASDGSTHRGEALLADALRAMLHAVTGGQATRRPGRRDLSRALASVRGRRAAQRIGGGCRSSAGQRRHPRLRCHRGADRAAARPGAADPRGHRAVRLRRHRHQHHPRSTPPTASRRSGPTVRHADLSGDLIDQALLTHVINDLSAAGSIDLSGTSAIGVADPVAGPVPRSQGTAVHHRGHLVGGRAARAPQRGAADP